MTAPNVAAGAVARKWLAEQYGVVVRGCLTAIGEIDIPIDDWTQVESNPFFAANTSRVEALEAYMDGLRKAGDSVGAAL